MKIDFNIIPAICAVSDAVLTNDKGLSIKGQVKEGGISIPCRVRLFEKLSGRLVFDVETDENGFYVFNYLNKTRFFLVAHHPTSQYNAVIQDNIIPE